METHHCESCGRAACVLLAFPETTYTLCLGCVSPEDRLRVVAIPGLESQLDLDLVTQGAATKRSAYVERVRSAQ